MHRTYAINEKGRDFIIGDLHGEFNLLQAEMKQVRFDTKVDRLFSVGDLIDRGEESLLCLQMIDAPWFFPVLGNHEDLMLKGLQDRASFGLWMMNGGDWINAEDINEVNRLAIQVEQTLPLSITVATKKGNIGICHAQPPSLNWNDTHTPDKEQVQGMIWGRDWIQDPHRPYVENIGRTYHGHTFTEHPTLLGNVAFIDTGAVFTGNLTMMELTANFNNGDGA